MIRKQDYSKWALGAAGAVLGYFALDAFVRNVINRKVDTYGKILVQDDYSENLLELLSAFTRLTPQLILETSLRAAGGDTIKRPLGTTRKFPSLDDVILSPAQLSRLPTNVSKKINTKVVIGPRARKPLEIGLPIMIAPMGYGFTLSEKFKLAIAYGASASGTAICNGEGPYLASERKASKKYIYQYHRGHWNKTPEMLANSDGIEIQFGQGARGGVGHIFKADDLDEHLRRAFQVKPGQDVETPSRQPGVHCAEDAIRLIKKIKAIGKGIPVGAKIAAGRSLEQDLEILCRGGIDFVTIEGGEGGSGGASPILEDDFGVPTIFAINRTAKWLKKKGLSGKVSLVACGKLRNAGDVLKAIALGADACYIGTMALFATAHTQTFKAVPFEPPTQLAWYDGKYAADFDVKEGAISLKRYLSSIRKELQQGIRAVGKENISDVDREDLMALNQDMAKWLGLPGVWEAHNKKDLQA